mmetsp:Transcript_82555/g.96544  ORF Transcript_82555/g.96544 Transcript_82555/m.96544 type:complete len:172 (-) Transcript_82555:54-569(-)
MYQNFQNHYQPYQKPKKSKALLERFLTGFLKIYLGTSAIFLIYCIARFAIILTQTVSYTQCDGFMSVQIAPLVVYGAWTLVMLILISGFASRSAAVIKMMVFALYLMAVLELVCIILYFVFGKSLYGDCYFRGNYTVSRLLSALAEAFFGVFLAIKCEKGCKLFRKIEAAH